MFSRTVLVGTMGLEFGSMFDGCLRYVHDVREYFGGPEKCPSHRQSCCGAIFLSSLFSERTGGLDDT